jgi:AAT family amino acid transporter
MSSEAIAVSVLLRKWFPGLSIPLLGSSVIVGVSMLNLLGATRLSKLESGLAAIKLLALAGFIILSFGIILGLVPGVAPVGPGSLRTEPLAPGGIGGIAGSMLLVMFAYAGFEIIGLAASETADPHRTVPRAITITVLALIGLYLLTIVALLPLIPTGLLTTGKSPLVAALERQRLGWAGNAMNVVLVTAILSTMLAAMFGLGRMLRSLADEGHAPPWLGGRGDVPYRGILASGAGMLLALAFGFLLPKEVYLFLVSSGGFALLFSYAVILATHYRLRRRTGCPPKGKCQLPGYPVTSWLALGASVLIIGSMPLVPGQGAGLAAGLFLVVFFSGLYLVTRAVHRRRS